MKISSILQYGMPYIKKYWMLLSIYVIVFIIIIIGVLYFVENEVEISREEIDRRTSVLYKDNEGFCFRENSSYTIVSYKLSDKPSADGKDSSTYEQMYGNTKYYFVAKNRPWNIIQYKKEAFGTIYAYRIEPCAVASKSNNSIAHDFKQLYDYLKSGYNVCNFDLSPEKTKTSFHYLEKRIVDLGSDTLWYDYYSDKLFFTKRVFATYQIEEEHDKVSAYILGGIFSLTFIETLLFALFIYLKKRLNNHSLLSLVNKRNHHVLKPEISESGISDLDYDVLLHKINPINFMDPYDAEKVKLANDLYSVLLKSRDNDTIVKMIEEKAKKELKI